MSRLRRAMPPTGGAPFAARPVLAGELLDVIDVRCAPDPPGVSPEEAAGTVEVVLPLSGAFVRHVRRGGGPRPVVGDPATAHVFRVGETYRVTHPAGGGDRSAVIALRPAGLEDLGRPIRELPDAVATRPGIDLFLRRWLRAVERGVVDELGATEGAIALLDALFGSPPVREVRADPLVDAVRLEVAASLDARLTLPELGRRVGASPFHLARRFRAVTGTTIHGWRTTLRVREAVARVDAGERDLTRLALDLGFAHHSHLTNTVRAATGRPPSAFRPDPTPTELGALRTILQA